VADARTFIKVHDGLDEHPKVEELSDRAFRHLITLWCYCSRNLTDGKVAERTWKRITTPATTRELLANRLAKQVEGGYEMHDYLEHQRSRAEVEGLSEKRRAAGKKGGMARAQAQASAQASATANSKQNGSRAEQSRLSPPPPSSNAPPEPAESPPAGGEREATTNGHTPARQLAATLLQDSPQLDNLPAILTSHQVRAPAAWLRAAAANGDLAALLETTPPDSDPWAHLPVLNPKPADWTEPERTTP
jgi:hypothetical protein